jgi:isobutyryl-CoA mutase
MPTSTQDAPATMDGIVPIRVVTSTALFDGHDAAINIMRRLLQAQGAEVIHLGHNRSVEEIAQAAVQEDADAVAVSSYQGGHNEYFRYLIDRLADLGASHIQVFGGGGGVIVPDEIAALETYGVNRIYSPEDGRQLGIQGLIADMLERVATQRRPRLLEAPADWSDPAELGSCLSAVEIAQGAGDPALSDFLRQLPENKNVPVLGITGTGGAGKSSLTDELALRFRADFPDRRLAILSVDPTRQKTGGALLGDRIRMNVMAAPGGVFMRSVATRGHRGDTAGALEEMIQVLRAASFDLIIVETAGIGQADAGIVSLVDVSLYVMTAEFGAASQLEKIAMLDEADVVAINKFDRAGSMDALRDVRKQYQRDHERFDQSPECMPVFGTTASRFNDRGVTALYLHLLGLLKTAHDDNEWDSSQTAPGDPFSEPRAAVIPPQRVHYLAEISDSVRRYHGATQASAEAARRWWHVKEAGKLAEGEVKVALGETERRLDSALGQDAGDALSEYERLERSYDGIDYEFTVRRKVHRVPLRATSLSGTSFSRVALPKVVDPGAQIEWVRSENVPGQFPFTAGVFPFRRADEDPTRMFAGEGDARRTNARFHLLAKDSKAKRLSTAFDSVTLYGWDPEERPDVLGKVGSSGVSICTLDDMKQLYEGFDLAAPETSVSMTINGPAPAVLALFFNTAIDQALEKFQKDQGRPAEASEEQAIQAEVLRTVRGTVQADVLKEDQGQNTCIFAVDFALRMMGDIQAYFIEHRVRNFYSVSISGYHIAEAGANPITQLAFTLANGFTYVEHYLSRGMAVDDFAPNLSFFFSCGMDPEYAVLNRVARRIWAIAMRERYGATERSQKLKAHIQTSGRSLHAQEVDFNDIRTTLEALTAYYDQCSSLHTNAYDEAVTTPTEGSVRRAVAIQLIVQREHGLSNCENPLQGSYLVTELTELVEEAVLCEFERLSERGGVLGAMERGYQRGKIQEESLHYEQQKSDGSYPIIGVNTFLNPNANHEAEMATMELRRGTSEEKTGQLHRLASFKDRHREASDRALEDLVAVCRSGGNTFSALMAATRVCSLGQITRALFDVGGSYRRNT